MVRSKLLRVGVAQMRLTNHLGRNLREMAYFAQMAREVGVEVLCFPECALTGYGPRHHDSSAQFDPDAVEAAVVEARGLAREMNVALVIGAHLPLEGGWSNSALLIASNGRVVTRYDKAHLYERDVEFYRAGRARPKVVTVKRARVGMQICFDVRFPEPFRALALEGAEIIFVPSFIHGKGGIWKRPIVEAHGGSRAAENGRFVVFANAAGAEQNVPSMIADPLGRIVAKCRRGARQLLSADLNLRNVRDELLACRRTDLYGSCP